MKLLSKLVKTLIYDNHVIGSILSDSALLTNYFLHSVFIQFPRALCTLSFYSLACPSFISTFVCTQSTNQKSQWVKHFSHWLYSFLAVSQQISTPLSMLFPFTLHITALTYLTSLH